MARSKFCSCDKLTIRPPLGWFERLMILVFPHFDIIKTIELNCKTCGGSGTFSGVDWKFNQSADACDYCIRGKKKYTVLYLRRFYLFRSKWLGLNFGDLYLHKIYRSDNDPDPHDHPWNFRTFILKGGYTDEAWTFMKFYEGGKESGRRVRLAIQDDKVSAPATRFRNRKHIHRVILKNDRPAWTLVWTSGYVFDKDGNADWNFITKDAIVPWRKYLGLDNGEEHGG